MIKFTILLRRNPAMTHDEFVAYQRKYRAPFSGGCHGAGAHPPLRAVPHHPGVYPNLLDTSFDRPVIGGLASSSPAGKNARAPIGSRGCSIPPFTRHYLAEEGQSHTVARV